MAAGIVAKGEPIVVREYGNTISPIAPSGAKKGFCLNCFLAYECRAF